MNNTPLAALCCAVSAGSLAAGLAGHALAFGIGSVALIAGLTAMGLRAPGRSARISLGVLAAFGVAFCSLLALAGRLHDPAGPLVLIGGFPAGTAMLVYGICPLGIVLGLAYGLTFERETLPREVQDRFLRRFGRR